ncbi:hypothetical protein [Spirosoma endbachense]|uniref:Uncharacterized protein n=1 Tax=Spirosoma endbachense TaxID=2666025 RepID=A0A6P1W768_9BACT|nr:hypothetical protein [Spirosoma endbachense]QHV99760.1 hypothetical protein GJR95_34215 [Spirosoma endbachense]
MAFFFDSHIHPSLKKQFANPVEVPVSGLPAVNSWRTIDTEDFNVSLPASLPIDKVADRIFFENGRDFVIARLDAINALP